MLTDTEKIKSIDPLLISVVLPVYNGAAYLREALDSILTQTYTHFELIIINDGSRDDSGSIIESYTDPRIRYFSQENLGLAATLNRGIELAQGDYIARQDQDDISLPRRFEKQLDFLEAHPRHGMVGSWAEIWEGSQKTERCHRHPAESAELRFELLFNNPFVHSSMLIRREVFSRVGLYSTDKNRQPPEDYELWSRVAREFEVANLPEPLLAYREMPGSMSRVAKNPFMERVVNLSIENLSWLLGPSAVAGPVADLAALAEYACHRLSPRPDFVAIVDAVREAARRIASASAIGEAVPEAKIDAFLRIIRRRYLKYRFGRVLGTMLNYTSFKDYR